QWHRVVHSLRVLAWRPHGLCASGRGRRRNLRRSHQQRFWCDRSECLRLAIFGGRGAMSPQTALQGKPASAVVEGLRSFFVRFGLGACLIGLWQYLAMRAGSIFFPPPSEIVTRAVELWLSGPPSRLFLGDGVFQDIIPSLGRLLAGWS